MWAKHTGSRKANFSDGSPQLQFMMDIMRLSKLELRDSVTVHGDESDRREMKLRKWKQSHDPQ